MLGKITLQNGDCVMVSEEVLKKALDAIKEVRREQFRAGVRFKSKLGFQFVILHTLEANAMSRTWPQQVPGIWAVSLPFGTAGFFPDSFLDTLEIIKEAHV